MGAGFLRMLPVASQPLIKCGYWGCELSALPTADPGPGRDGGLPAFGLSCEQFVDHLAVDVGVVVGDVGRPSVPEPLTAQHARYPVAAHRGLVAVPEAVRCEARR